MASYHPNTVLEFFRTNRFFNSLLLLPYVVVLRVLAIPGGFPTDIPTRGILSQWIVGDVFSSTIWSIIVGIVLVYIQTLQLNRVVIQNRMTQELTLFPGMVYALFVSYFPGYDGLSSPLIANTFILIALESLFATHKKTGAPSRIFDTGLWLSVAGLFYFGYIGLFLFGIVGLSALRTLKSREWLQYIIGYVTPLMIISMLDFVLHDNLDNLTMHFSQNLGAFDFKFTGMRTFAHAGFFGLMLLVSLFNFGAFKHRKNIHTQKKIDLLLWLLIFGFVVILLQVDIGVADWIVLTIPLSCFIAMIIAQSKQVIILEVIHFLFFAGSLALQVWWIWEN